LVIGPFAQRAGYRRRCSSSRPHMIH
jgi:hypothetical protein